MWLVLALVGAIGLDAIFGDPPNRYHPVAWLGRIIASVAPRLNANSGGAEKRNGAVFAIVLVLMTAIVAMLVIYVGAFLTGVVGIVIASTIILKLTIAIKGMEKHARAIIDCLERDDIAGARYDLSMIVRRPTDDLSEQHILSATIECISESTVDGITGPILYFSLLGPAGAAGYRAINTLDSMVGYRDDNFRNTGWMSARLDTAANYVPARITAFLMVISAKIIGADWNNSLRILHRDHTKTFSPNAGYPMATMAGALRVRLEKVGHYSLGDAQEPATIAKCRTALSIMKLTTVLFALVVSLPLISVLYLAGWWRILLGIP
jgi:adenosylcobinamide-phosphate synthase